jgi:cytochrome c553
MQPALENRVNAGDGEANGAGELLASEALLSSLAQLQCRRCSYLTTEGTLIDRRRRCPHCKQAGERRLFPSLNVLSRCDLLREIYAMARQQRSTRARAFARTFRRRFACALSDGQLADLAAHVAATAAAERAAGAESREAETAAEQYAALGELLHLASDGETEAAYGRLLLFAARSPVEAAVVLLAETILRDLVCEVLAARLKAGGASEAEAAARLVPAKDLASLERLFAEITRRPLRDELEQRSDGDFAAAWWRLSERLQRGAAAITAADADTAFRLVSGSAAPIAELANAVVAGRRPFHPRRPRRGTA